jgi:hypothetical protein
MTPALIFFKSRLNLTRANSRDACAGTRDARGDCLV